MIIGATTEQSIPGIVKMIEAQLEKADIVRLTRSQAYVVLAMLTPLPPDEVIK